MIKYIFIGTSIVNLYRLFFLNNQLLHSLPYLECPVCYIRSIKLDKLPCQHRICHDCYQKILSNKVLSNTCPICRQKLIIWRKKI